MGRAGSGVLLRSDSTGFAGLNLFFQWAIIDAGGGILGSFSATDALQVVIGS